MKEPKTLEASDEYGRSKGMYFEFRVRLVVSIPRGSEYDDGNFYEIRNLLDSWSASDKGHGYQYRTRSVYLTDGVFERPSRFKDIVESILESHLSPYRLVITKYDEISGSFVLMVTGLLLTGVVQYATLRESFELLSKDLEDLGSAATGFSDATRSDFTIRQSALLSDFANDINRGESGLVRPLNDHEIETLKVEWRNLEMRLRQTRAFFGAGYILLILTSLFGFYTLQQKIDDKDERTLSETQVVDDNVREFVQNQIKINYLERKVEELKAQDIRQVPDRK